MRMSETRAESGIDERYFPALCAYRRGDTPILCENSRLK
jgi:hypothetical protein